MEVRVDGGRWLSQKMRMRGRDRFGGLRLFRMVRRLSSGCADLAMFSSNALNRAVLDSW